MWTCSVNDLIDVDQPSFLIPPLNLTVSLPIDRYELVRFLPVRVKKGLESFTLSISHPTFPHKLPIGEVYALKFDFFLAHRLALMPTWILRRAVWAAGRVAATAAARARLEERIQVLEFRIHVEND